MTAHSVDCGVRTTPAVHCLQQILVDVEKQSVVTAYHVSNGIDHCCIVFLKSELLKYSKRFEGVLAQVIHVHPGHSDAVIFLCIPEETINQITIPNEPDETDSKESLA